MWCPNCYVTPLCGCPSCIKKRKPDDLIWVRHGDETESCPSCGLRKHLDEWLDVEYEQYKFLKRLGWIKTDEEVS
jgi:hypothetical protein